MQKELITLIDEASGMQHLVQVRLIALKGSSTEAQRKLEIELRMMTKGGNIGP